MVGNVPLNSYGIFSNSLYSLTPIGFVISFKEYSSTYVTMEFVQQPVAQILNHYILEQTFSYTLNFSMKILSSLETLILYPMQYSKLP